MRARSRLVEGFRSVVDDGRGHSIVTDLPVESGGGDTAPTALELSIMALASCTTTMFALIAKGKHLSFRSVEVIVEAEKPAREKTVTSGRTKGIVISSDPEESIRKVWNDTLRICPVGILFDRAAVKFEEELEILRP